MPETTLKAFADHGETTLEMPADGGIEKLYSKSSARPGSTSMLWRRNCGMMAQNPL